MITQGPSGLCVRICHYKHEKDVGEKTLKFFQPSKYLREVEKLTLSSEGDQVS